MPQGLALFTGGASLVKAGHVVYRFVDDLAFQFQGDRDWDSCPSDDLARDVHADLRDVIAQHVAPLLPGGQVSTAESAYARGRTVQRVALRYRSFYQTEPGRIRLELRFMPQRVPWTMRDIYPHPMPLRPHFPGLLLGRMACVASWATMTGKLHAVACMSPGTDWRAMRHVVDLATWGQQYREDAIFAYMAQLSRSQGLWQDLQDHLENNLNALERHPASARLYAACAEALFPGMMWGDLPPWSQAVGHLRRVWRNICQADGDKAMEPYPIPNLPPPGTGMGPADDPRSRFQTKSMPKNLPDVHFADG